jgi:hypothetical protein
MTRKFYIVILIISLMFGIHYYYNQLSEFKTIESQKESVASNDFIQAENQDNLSDTQSFMTFNISENITAYKNLYSFANQEKVNINGYHIKDSYLFYKNTKLKDQTLNKLMDRMMDKHYLTQVISKGPVDHLYFQTQADCCQCYFFNSKYIEVDRKTKQTLVQEFTNQDSFMFRNSAIMNYSLTSPDGTKIAYLKFDRYNYDYFSEVIGPESIFILDLITNEEKLLGNVQNGTSLVSINRDPSYFDSLVINKDLIYWQNNPQELIVKVPYSK